MRQGTKAEHEYRLTECVRYLIVPFLAKVTGLPVNPLGTRRGGYDCTGNLVPLGAFCAVEFFVCPFDFEWSMIHTHEDHAFGGPYFIRAEWIP